MIKRALDAGAHGILVPVLEMEQDAKNVVRYSKYPPLGNRGFEPLLAVEKFVEQHQRHCKKDKTSPVMYFLLSVLVRER